MANERPRTDTRKPAFPGGILNPARHGVLKINNTKSLKSTYESEGPEHETMY